MIENEAVFIRNENECDCDEDNKCGCSYPNNVDEYDCGCIGDDNCSCVDIELGVGDTRG